MIAVGLGYRRPDRFLLYPAPPPLERRAMDEKADTSDISLSDLSFEELEQLENRGGIRRPRDYRIDTEKTIRRPTQSKLNKLDPGRKKRVRDHARRVRREEKK